MFGLSQLVYGNSAARLFAFFYLALMHGLVFASLLRMTHASSQALYSHTQVGVVGGVEGAGVGGEGGGGGGG